MFAFNYELNLCDLKLEKGKRKPRREGEGVRERREGKERGGIWERAWRRKTEGETEGESKEERE